MPRRARRRPPAEGQARAGGDFHLEAHQVESGYQFGDGVLHLEAGVHFQEVEAPVGIHQKFDRAGVVVAGGARGADGGLPHLVAHSRGAAR